MNIPPKEALRVAPEALREFVTAAFKKVGLTAEDACLLAHLLVLNDLRGVFSHGTRRLRTYLGQYQQGQLNPRPEVRLVSETPTTTLFDGDGGVGYFPAYRAAEAIIEKAQTYGLAATATRNHGHIGAAGLYSRIPVEQNLICFCVSGHQLKLDPGRSIMDAAGGSPMTFAIPAGREPPLVLDFGTMHDLYSGSPHLDELIEMAPGLVFRSMGLGNVCQALGGLLVGLSMHPERDARAWPGGNQGAFLMAVEISRFLPLEDFLREMEEYSRQARKMQPLPGHHWAGLPGGLEWEREQEWSVSGIPVGPRHREALAAVGQEFGLPTPF